MKLSVLFLISVSSASVAIAQTAPTSISIVTTAPAATTNNSLAWSSPSAPYTTGTTYTNRYGQTSSGAGTERVVNGFSIGVLSYSKIPASGSLPFNKVIIKRHPSVAGSVINTLYEYTTPSGNTNYFLPSYEPDLENIINSFTCNRGSDNMFANSGSTFSNIERVDLVLTAGVVCVNPGRQGILINERNGNDPFRVAPITSLNGAQEVASLGTLLNIPTTAWGRVGPGFVSTVMSRETGVDVALRPKQNIASQQVSGVYITLADLGIPVGTTIYGLSLFPNDVTSAMDLVGLTNVPSNTNETAGGLDLMAGGGFFVENSTLPVNFISFTAKEDNRIVQLEWETGNEENSAQFTIQYSTDVNSWQDIGTVAASGNSNHLRKYNYTHTSPLNGYNYYRVLHTGLNGEQQYSKINKIEIKNAFSVQIYPNPAREWVWIRLPVATPSVIRLFNASGQQVYYQRHTEASIRLPLAGLSKQVYQLIIEQDGKRFMQSLLHQ